MDFGLTGRVGMVAAGSKGLGLATAIALVKEGCGVSICARGRDALDIAREQLLSAAANARVHAQTCDVKDPVQLMGWHRDTVSALGEVDVLVTNTGGPPAGRFAEIDDHKWREGIDLTLMNVVRLCRLVIPSMRARHFGRIVNITSLAAKQPVDVLTVSSTLRAGLSALTRTLATELARDGITVNAVLPGHVLTDRQLHLNELRAKEKGISLSEAMATTEAHVPLGRFGRPEEIGDVVAFLCSGKASFLTGASVQVDGGMIQSTF